MLTQVYTVSNKEKNIYQNFWIASFPSANCVTTNLKALLKRGLKKRQPMFKCLTDIFIWVKLFGAMSNKVENRTFIAMNTSLQLVRKLLCVALVPLNVVVAVGKLHQLDPYERAAKLISCDLKTQNMNAIGLETNRQSIRRFSNLRELSSIFTNIKTNKKCRISGRKGALTKLWRKLRRLSCKKKQDSNLIDLVIFFRNYRCIH